MYCVRLARSDDLSALPGIERAANALFAAYGLADQFSNLLAPLESLSEGMTTGRLWVAADETDRPVGFALASIVGDNAHLDIYFRNRGTETPRQYVLALGEIIIKEWETLQEPAA